MPINTKSSYVEFGSNYNSSLKILQHKITIPTPHSLPFSDNRIFDAARNNSTGQMIMKQIGRTMYKESIKLSTISNAKFWEINRWLNTYGTQFYARYFSHTDGKIKVQRFYMGEMSDCEPSKKQVYNSELGIYVPASYKGATITMIDMGEPEVYIEGSITL